MAGPLSPERARRVYDRIGSAQDTQGFYERPAVAAMLAHADPERARAVLEVGCGTGRLAEELLRDHLPDDTTYLGLDLSPRMVELSRERVRPWGGRAEVRVTDGSARLPAGDDSIDLALSTYVFDLLGEGDTRALLASLDRALGEGGRLGAVSLTAGGSGLPWLVSAAWTGIWRVRPELTGGCRPIELGELLTGEGWSLMHREVVQAWGVSSEVVVAAPPGR